MDENDEIDDYNRAVEESNAAINRRKSFWALLFSGGWEDLFLAVLAFLSGFFWGVRFMTP